MSVPHRPAAAEWKDLPWPFFTSPRSSAHLEPQSLHILLDPEDMRMDTGLPSEIGDSLVDFPLRDFRGLNPKLVTGRSLNESQGSCRSGTQS